MNHKPSVYISCKMVDRSKQSEAEGLCIHSFSTIKELPEYWVVMCEELQKQISKEVVIT